MAKFGSNLERTQKATKMERGMAAHANSQINAPFFSGNPLANRVPAYYIGVFNVSTRSIKVKRDWAFSHQVIIPAREDGEFYSKPYILPDIKYLPDKKAGFDEISWIAMKGEFLAQDIVNVNDPYGDWHTAKTSSEGTRLSDGNNFYDRGLFWVRLATPEAEPDLEAVETAITRMEAYYQQLVRDANKFYASGPKQHDLICEPHHAAAEYFEIDAPWHRKMEGSLKSQLRSKLDVMRAAKAVKDASIGTVAKEERVGVDPTRPIPISAGAGSEEDFSDTFLTDAAQLKD